MNASLIRTEDLSVGYGCAVLSGVDLDIGSGQFVSLLGPNGSGKTTLLRTLSRHLAALSGQIWLGGRPLASYTALELARTLAVVLTEKAAPPLLSVLEYVALGRHPHTGFLGRLDGKDVEIVKRSLAAVRAEALADRWIDRLSDGERQKVVLARALAQEPGIMLLDEPTAYLDLKHRVEIMAILRNLCRERGLTVLAAIHDIDVAAKVSDRVIMIRDGRVMASGSPEDAMTSGNVAGLYDFSEASFSRDLGGMEIRGDGRAGRAFVLAGRGKGTVVYRLLAKKGFAFVAGFPEEADLDAHVARALEAEVVYRAELHRNGGLERAMMALDRCDFLIDAGGPADVCCRLLEAARERGLPVLTQNAEMSGCRHYQSLPELIDALEGLSRKWSPLIADRAYLPNLRPTP
ncbi:MAG: ABC transporter ATP-binding protein [Candidatus Accumulibacter sp.]|jgi:iron complex transport system ATP-binding protein|nr:ABC transporter ATP-binding protein [Accumulibacter sp.]